MDSIKIFFYKIKNLLSYFPVIWNSPTHDYYSIMDMTIFKLKKLLKLKEKLVEQLKGLDDCYDVDIPKIKVSITLFERAYNDYYFDKISELMKLKYGNDVLKINFIKVKGESESLKYFKLQNEYDTWDNAKEVDEYYRSLVKKYNKKQEKVNRLCWEYFVHYGQTWW